MKRLTRKNRGTRITDHENRVQVLERRIPEDYPYFGSALGTTFLVQNAGTYPLGWDFPDDDPCELPDCDPDDWHTSGDYMVLPAGYDGAFEVYMTAACTGGNSNFGNYHPVTDVGDQDIHGKSNLRYIVEVWRNGEPFGFCNYKGFTMRWEGGPPEGTNPFGVQRFWALHSLFAGICNINIETDRYYLKPVFDLNETLAGQAQIQGLAFVVKLFAGAQRLAGYSGS